MAAVAATTTATSSRWWNWSWKPTSAEKLRSSEEKMLSILNTPFELSSVLLENGEHINTLKMGQGPPLVMIHGFAGGLALFAANLEFLAQTHTVYAIDLPGFGRSSRPAFTGETTSEAEEYFVTRFEAWMDAVQLESAIIMGHSLGAYLSAAWAIRNPARFQRLMLVDPFGVGKRPSDEEEEEWRKKRRVRAFIVDTIKAVSNSPLTLLRAAGPFGPGLIKRLRPDLIEKFSHLHPGPSDAVSDYIYHINAQSPSSGEEAFSKLLSKTGIGWAAEPLIDRLPLLDTRVPVSFIYGEDSWMNPLSGVMLKESMPHHNTDFVVIPDAGHHVYIDQWQLFNEYALLSAQGRLDTFSKRQYASLVRQLRAMAEEQAMQAQIKVSAQPSQIS
jgi:abhydrolase domain-containing protein 4